MTQDLPRLAGRLCLFGLVSIGVADMAVAQSPAGRGTEADGGTETDANVRILPPITVTATRSEKTLFETPSNVTAVTGEELGRRMDNTIEELFRYEPGIEVPRQSSGTDPFNSSGGVRIRGVGTNRTQVLVDGNRTLERITDSTRDVVDANAVKQVEIVRGPGSVLWGSDGLGGVVNFITKDPDDYLVTGRDWAVEGSASYATVDDAFIETVAGAYRVSDAIAVSLSYTRRDAEEIDLSNARAGDDAVQPCPRNAEATQCDAFDPTDIGSNNVLGKLVWDLSPDNRLRFTGEFFDRITDVDQNSVLGPATNFRGAVTADIESYEREQEVRRWRASVDQDWDVGLALLDNVKWQLTYSPQEVNRSGERLRTRLPSGERERRRDSLDYSEDFYEADVQLTSSFDLAGSRHTLTYGFDGDYQETDYERVDVTSNLTTGVTTTARAGGFNFANATTRRADGYLQDEIALFDGRLTLVPGARLAYYKIEPEPDADYEIVPGAEPRDISETDLQLKFGAIVDVWGPISVYGQYAEGFKMPTAQQLFQSLDSLPFFALVPNANLEPESVESYEAGLRGDFGGRGFFSVNGFFADYTDFIRNFVAVEDPTVFGLPATAQTLTYDNVDNVEVYGVEFAGGWRFDDRFSVRAAVSHQWGQEEDNGVESEFNGALPWGAVVGLRWDERRYGFSVELVGNFQTDAHDVDDPDIEFRPDGYAVFDLIAEWELLPNAVLRGAVYNLFDTRYFGPETVGHPINRRDDVLRVNPVELQSAPGVNAKIGLALRW